MGRNNTDGSVVIDTKLNTSGAEKGLHTLENEAGKLDHAFEKVKNTVNKIGNTVKKVGKLIAAAFAVKAIVGFANECLELGSDLAEVQNVVDSVFKTMSRQVEEFAKSAVTMYGLSETMAKQFTGTFGSMAKAFGFTEKEALSMSTTLAGLAGDVASFYNIDQEAAFTKLKSVFSGETESLKDLGVVMTQAALDQYALANGFGKVTKDMTEQEKVALRYRFVLDKLSTASGDFAKTSDGWANQVRILKLQIDSLKATIGQGLINVLTPVLKVINTIIGKLAILANAFKSFTELITGKKSSGSTDASGAGLGGEEMAEIADYTDSAADATYDLADAQKDNAKATKAARKEQEKYLSGLDEIRRFESNKDSDSDSEGIGNKLSNGAGSIGRTIAPVDYGATAKGETELEKTDKVLDKIIQKAKELTGIFKIGFSDGIGDFSVRVQGILTDVDSIKKALIDIFTDPEVIKAAEDYCDQVVYFLGRITGAAASIGLTLAQLLVGAIADFLEKSEERIRQHLINMFDIKGDILAIVGDFMAAFARIFEAFGDENAQRLLGSVLSIVYEVGALVEETAGKLIRDLLDILTWPFIENQEIIRENIDRTLGVIADVFEGFLSIVQKVSDEISGFYDKHLSPLFSSIAGGASMILALLSELYNTWVLPNLEKAGEKFKELAEGPVGDAIRTILSILGDITDAITFLWDNVAVPFFSYISTIAMSALGSLASILSAVVLTALEGVSNFINDVLGPVWETFTTFISTTFGPIITDIGNWLDDLRTGYLEKVGDYVSGAFETAWEKLHEFLNGPVATVIDTIKLAFDILYTEILQPLGTFISGTLLESWGSLTTFIDTFLGPVITDVSNWFTGLKTDVLEVLADFISGVFTEAWKVIQEFLTGPVVTAIEAIKTNLETFYTVILVPLEAFLSEKLYVAWEALTTFFTTVLGPALADLCTWLKDLKNKYLSKVANYVSGTFNRAWKAIMELWNGAFGKALRTLKEAVGAFYDEIIVPLGTYVADKLLAAWTDLKDYWENDLGPKLEALHEAFRNFWENVLKPLALTIQKTLLNAWKKITKFFNGDGYDGVIKVSGVFKFLWEKVLEPLADFISNTLGVAFEGLETIFSGLITFITGVFSVDWANAWDSVVAAFGNIWDKLVDLVKTPLRKVISVVNTIINAINSAIGGIESAFTFDIPVAVPEYMQGGGIGASQYTISNWAKFPRIPTINLPFLAKGAVIPPKAPFMAMLGDQKSGNNLEAPEELLRKIVREETRSTGNSQYRFMANINRRVLFDEMITEAQLRRSQSGRNPFEMG